MAKDKLTKDNETDMNTVIPDVLVDEEPPAPDEKQKPAPNLRLMERELRRYVKRNGGFRKGLPAATQKRAKWLMKQLKRTEPVWDCSVQSDTEPYCNAPTSPGRPGY